jgi:6,7-dimethyl-8-ribityllumazine synthase
MNLETLEGDFQVASDARFAIVASRFNHFIVDRLVDGAVDALTRHGVSADQITLVRVPGAWEIPWAVARLAKAGQYAAVVALGAVIRGATPHFDYVAGEATSGLARCMQETGVPVGFGVITTDSIEQAIERAGTKAGNKGWDAAMAALEMVGLERALRVAEES